MLNCVGLRTGYGSGQVLDGVDLTVGEGEVVGVLGRNGVGKSTLLKLLMGLLPLRNGSIEFCGQSIGGWGAHRIAQAGIAYVPQGREIFSQFSVEQNLQLGAMGADVGFDIAYELFPGLAALAASRAGNLSGGQQQQLAVARAMMARPRLLLLDEPSEGVQPSIVAEIAERIGQAARQHRMAIVLVEQSVELAVEMCDRVAFLEHGRIAEVRPAAALHEQPELLDRYLAFATRAA